MALAWGRRAKNREHGACKGAWGRGICLVPVWINLETHRLVFAFYGLEGLWFSGIPFDQVLLFQLRTGNQKAGISWASYGPDFHVFICKWPKMKWDYLWNLEKTWIAGDCFQQVLLNCSRRASWDGLNVCFKLSWGIWVACPYVSACRERKNNNNYQRSNHIDLLLPAKITGVLTVQAIVRYTGLFYREGRSR